METTADPIHCPKTARTSVHERLKMGPSYLPTLRKCCIPILCRRMLTMVTERELSKLCQMVEAEKY